MSLVKVVELVWDRLGRREKLKLLKTIEDETLEVMDTIASLRDYYEKLYTLHKKLSLSLMEEAEKA